MQEIHNLCENDEDPHFIKALNLSMDWKLVFHSLGRRMHYKDAFGYASQKLLNQNVMIIQADCYVDKGFENLNDSLLNRKILYALSRHETPENVRQCKTRNMCGRRYIGSHDAYLFRLLAPLSPKLMTKIDYRTNLNGIEQLLFFNFRKYEKFDIKNPCKILHIFHHHCSGLREGQYIQGKRIDRFLKIKTKRWAKFSEL